MEVSSSVSGGESRAQILARVAAEAGAQTIAEEALALAARVRTGLFYVACVGQFKRGKSSLLNALVADPLLPTGVVPVTTVVTIVRYGPQRGARVRLAGGTWRDIDIDALGEYVSEEKNPENGKGVSAVEVFTPSPLLASGMCLVDTPGIGSVFLGNTEATRAFVPHVDAALVVLGADPPISADELALVEEIAKQCPDLLFVLNKADKLPESERDEAVEFTRRILSARLGKNEAPVYEVSATEQLAGQGPQRRWPDLTAALERLAHEAGSDLVRAAEERGLALLAQRLRRCLDEERGALLRPIEESEQRIGTLHACVAEAEMSLSYLHFLFIAEQTRLSRIFARRKEEFLKRAKPAAQREFVEALHAAKPRRGLALRSKAIDLAHDISKCWLDRWLVEAQPAAEALYVEATQRFVDLANNSLAKLADTGDPALSSLPLAVSPETGFRVRSRLYYTSMLVLTSQTPAGFFLDLLRSRERELAALERRVGRFLATLIFTNASRIVNDFDDRVLESRRQFEFQIRKMLTEVTALAEHALARAKERQEQGSQAVQAEVERIDSLSARLDALGPERKEPAT
jgi:GTP-binding protein EngB required for normal cell division